MSSMMQMPPDYAPGLPTAPGGGDPTQAGGNAPPMDALSGSSIPGQGGMAGLLAALQGGGGPDPTQGIAGGGAETDQGQGPTDSIGHIQEAMKHLMMAMAMDQSEGNNLGITKGMGALQGILAGHEKNQKQLSQLGG